MSEWQPIETAPKDGTPLLLFCPRDLDAWWRPKRLPKIAVGCWTKIDAFDAREHWYGDVSGCNHEGGSEPEPLHPTHWMPLPAPPEVREEFKAEIARLQADNERLRAALEPFASWIEARDSNDTTKGVPDSCPLVYCPDGHNAGGGTVGDLRRARAALAQPPQR